MLLVLSLGWATLQCGRFLLPPLLPRIQARIGLSTAGAGLALTAFGVVYAVTQYPSGAFSDTLSRATLILPGFLVLLASFGLLGGSVTVWLFVAAVVFLGLGKGLFASPSRALLGDLFTGTRGRALGIYSAGTDVGGLVAAGLAVAVLGFTWRVAFVPVVAVLALVMVLYVGWNREPYTVERIRLSPGATARRIAATPAQREMLVAYALFYFVVGGLINFFPTLLVAHGGFSEALASGSFALLFLVGLVTKPTAGEVSDRFSRLAVSILALLLAAVGFAVILLASSFVVVAAGTVLAAAGYKTQFPIADTVVMEAAPDGNVGGDLGAARGIFLLANALGPGFVGVVAEYADFAVAFWTLAGTLVLSALVLARQYLRRQ
jgi:MFS family permease